MKTVIISLSPRKSFSASFYFSSVVKLFMGSNDVSIINLKTEKQYLELEQQLDHIDNLVIVSPVYVDTVPSTVLERLVKIQTFAKNKNINLNVYAMTNCGFYEGEQNLLAQKTIEVWCRECGFIYMGGLGIGAGVMIAFTRFLPIIGVGIEFTILLIRILLGALSGNFNTQFIFNHYFPYTFIIQTCLYLLWNMGLFINGYKFAKHINSSQKYPLKYTTVWFCPRFLFVIIASIYWLVVSLVWYRGAFWRLHKQPKY